MILSKAAFRLKRLDYLWALESIIGFYTDLGYETMRRRFIDRYLEAVLSCCNGARYLLNRPDVVRQIEKQTKTFLRKENICLTREQFGEFLNVMHPDIAKIYWPVSGAVHTLRRRGFSGILKR